ncbi:hypothetical protein [Lentilactobacillus laojiaonis]|uniref:hypothetical protein n=1 Tax=Lentilactobacillus laojiaonis TaxID=2883998 RepID=UPI001D0B246C|nr:hypothetical protein [Lentilactobacillus laojiaonis]UDM31773.1 hypothetical protein LHL71_04280 [Lentilactobacillus laojiaonis]
MPSNSDTLYHALYYIKNHPSKIAFSQQKYNNALEMFIDDSVPMGNVELYFPDQKLAVNKMSSEFITMHNDLLDYYYNMTNQTDANFSDVWITSSHLVNQHKYLIDISFE